MFFKWRVRNASFARTCTALLWLFACYNDLQAIKIVNLVVPELVEYGVQDTVLLDCDYDYKNDTIGMVIKWFFQSRSTPVYQWIAGYKPQALNFLSDRVDLSYRASNDPYTMYRAMRIVNVNTDMTGEYTCVASTFMDEEYKTKQMTVFARESNFQLIQNKTDDDTVNVICVSDGAFPEPRLTLATPERKLTNVKHSRKMRNGRFSSVASVTLRDEELPSPAEFICILKIHEANYTIRKEAIYYPGPMSTTPDIPTAADMQLAAAVGLSGTGAYTQILMLTLSCMAFLLRVG